MFNFDGAPFTRILVLDFETRWCSKSYTLSKLTTEAYIRDKRFKAFGVGYKWYGDADDKIYWLGEKEVKPFFDRIDWSSTAVLAHNAQFDCAILSWVFGAKPAFIFDSLSMARALRGIEVGNSLAKLAEELALPPKGKAVHSTDGMSELTPPVEQELADYCKHDVFLCEKVFDHLVQGYPTKELKLIDLTLKMFTNPCLELDEATLVEAIHEERERREGLLAKLDIAESDLASNDKFASILRKLGVEPPLKKKKPTPKNPNPTGYTYAFAKNDALFQALLNGDNEDVALLCEARLAVKSTLERTRAQRFLDISRRGTLPVPLNYYGAHTGRWSASKGSGINLQNLKRGSFLRKSISAPEGYSLIVADLSQIEPRVLAYLCDYRDVLQIFASGQDAYAMFGAQMFNIPGMTKESHPDLRQSAKSALLGCGYGMGWHSFASQLLTGFLGAPPVLYDKAFAKQAGVDADIFKKFVDWDKNVERALEIPRTCTDEQIIIHSVATKQIVDKYRAAAVPVTEFWYMCNELIHLSLAGGKERRHKGLIFRKGEIVLPSGLSLKYPDLQAQPDEKGRIQWVYGKDKKKLYGGKIVENCIAEGTPVLTTRGWVPIESVRGSDLVHDGVEFVQHGGTVFKSVQGCVSIDGVYMTPDHEVLTDEGWQTASQKPRPYRPDIRELNRNKPGVQQWEKTTLALSMRLWKLVRKGWNRRNKRSETRGDTELRMPYTNPYRKQERNAWNEQASGVCCMALDARPVQTTFASSVGELRRQGYTGVHTLATKLRELLGRYGPYIRAGFGLEQEGQQRPLLSRKLRVDNAEAKLHESSQQFGRRHTDAQQANGDLSLNPVLQVEARPVFDIVNCGPRQRFVVQGATAPFIVHNCVQAVARCVMTDAMLRIQKRYPVVLTVHDEVVCLVPEDEAESAYNYMIDCMTASPKYMPGIPLAADGGWGKCYGDIK